MDVDNGEYVSIRFSITAWNLNVRWSILRLLAINRPEITLSVAFALCFLDLLNLHSVLGVTNLIDRAISFAIKLLKLLDTFDIFRYIWIIMAINFIERLFW